MGRILRDYGEESNWQFLQKQIAKARGSGGLHTTAELVDLIRRTSTSSGGECASDLIPNITTDNGYVKNLFPLRKLIFSFPLL